MPSGCPAACTFESALSLLQALPLVQSTLCILTVINDLSRLNVSSSIPNQGSASG